MTRSGRRASWILVAVLALVALIGFEQGLTHGLAAVRADQALAAANSQREPVPVAQPLLNTTPSLDEATVRRIAKEEADAAVARARPKKVTPRPAEDDDDSGGDADAAAPMSTTPSAPPPQPQG